MDRWSRCEGGLVGMLVGDACGVPYEFRSPDELPPADQLQMVPPSGFLRTYAHVPLGTWSDDGAQALCLLATLLECGRYHPHDFAKRLLDWHESGYMAVDGYVFDVGNQTSASIARLKKGTPPGASGLCGERNNGNGSLMRVLPLVLLHRGNDERLVADAHQQSRLTHGHPRSQVCCALYCLWARRELAGSATAWQDAVNCLREIYHGQHDFLHELENEVRPDDPPPAGGSGYVVDCLHSAHLACSESTYRAIIQAAIALGNDTDTTACVAGGIAGIRYGRKAIPPEWLETFRGVDILEPLIAQLKARILSG